jgi:hypothetical protein
MDDSNPDAIRTTNFERGHGRRRFTVRDAALVVVVVALGLLLLTGDSIKRTAEQTEPGLGHDVAVVLATPIEWLSDKLPLDDVADDATAWLSPDENLSGAEGFVTAAARTDADQRPLVTADAFDPADVGAQVRRRPLRRLLVTGDSLAMPLDVELARRLAPTGVHVDRDPHVGTGISKSALVDWAKLSTQQVEKRRPDAVVVFIGANEGFPLDGGAGRRETCCSAGWAAAYANRARLMMDTYRRAGAARVYWLLLPAPRDRDRAAIAHVVNAAIRVAAHPYRAQVRVLDMAAVFTPGWHYRSAMAVGGEQTIVREPDGIHLNDAGARVAADHVLQAIARDFDT